MSEDKDYESDVIERIIDGQTTAEIAAALSMESGLILSVKASALGKLKAILDQPTTDDERRGGWQRARGKKVLANVGVGA